MIRFPLIAILTIIASYAIFGWLLAIHNVQNLIYWIGSGALLFAINYFLALAWGVAAVVIVFAPKSNLLILSLGITTVWAALLYFARLEMLVLSSNRIFRFIVMFIMVAIALGGGILLDSAFINAKIDYFWQKATP
jgi:hypothetical protein